jgi:hypothetical protein
MNVLLIPTFLLAIGLFALGVLLGRRKGISHKFFVFLCVIGMAAALPGVAFAAYYFKIFREPIWLYEFRSWSFAELAAGGAGLLAGLLHGRFSPHPRFRRLAGRCFFPGALALGLLVPYAKPVLRPPQWSQFKDRWSDGVCLQTSESSCGPACVATLLHLSGKSATELEIARESFSSKSGTENWYLARALRRRGITVQFSLEKGADTSWPFPSIAGVRLPELGDTGHFITVLGSAGEKYVIGDPLQGRLVLSKLDLLGKYAFTGFFMRADPRQTASAPLGHELVRDPHFRNGFHLLAPEQGKRVVYADLAGPGSSNAVWDLGQWASRFPLQAGEVLSSHGAWTCSNSAKHVVVGLPGSPAAGLALAVRGSAEYGAQARKSPAEPWVHLLVQQDFEEQPSLTALGALNFHLEARLKQSILANTNGYTPALHAAQFTVYLTVANRNPQAAGYGECFWFGIPIYDDRHRLVPDYEAQDFGATRLFIFTPGTENFTSRSTHDHDWVVFDKDLLPLIRQGLQHAWARKFIVGSRDFADYRPLGIFIGWEVPGIFDVEMQMRNLSLKATPSS